MDKILKNNHKGNEKFKNIKEASKVYSTWRHEMIEKSKDEGSDMSFHFVFRGFSKTVRENKLNSSEVSLYFAIVENCEKTTGICRRTNKFLKEQLDMPTNTFDKALSNLEKKKLIYRDVSYNDNNRLIRAICLLPYS